MFGHVEPGRGWGGGGTGGPRGQWMWMEAVRARAGESPYGPPGAKSEVRPFVSDRPPDVLVNASTTQVGRHDRAAYCESSMASFRASQPYSHPADTPNKRHLSPPIKLMIP